MSLITLQSLGVTLGAPLFQDLNLTLNKGDRLGLVADNGRGKSTLLACLAGHLDPTEGRLIRARNSKTVLMAQHVAPSLLSHSPREVLLETLPVESRDWDAWRVDVALEDLAMPDELRDLPMTQLSGGWQRMVLAAQAAIQEPDLLLLDEPTNHLDLARIGWMQRWLEALPLDIAVVVASHDRAFLDAVTRRTLFLRARDSVDFPLTYSPAREAMRQMDEATARRHEADMKEAAKLRRQAAKLNNIGINSGSDLLMTKTKQLKARAERIETNPRSAWQEKPAGRLRLSQSESTAKALLRLEGSSVTAPEGRLLYRMPQLWIRPGDRVVLLGRNGSGKSTLFTKIADAIAGKAADGIFIAPSMVAGVCDQALSHLPLSDTPAHVLLSQFSLSEQRARSLLAEAGIAVEKQTRALAKLSGGQRMRLAMLILRLQAPNFYLLDEPTNHLDIDGQEALEAELMRQEAACLLVSHDRRFVETVGNRFWRIDGNCLVECEDPGDFFCEVMS